MTPSRVSRATPALVGDGFRNVRALPGPSAAMGDDAVGPFLLLDHMPPTPFPARPDSPPLGVGAHPHRGFETVTFVYEGSLEHRDSTGAQGRLDTGDVQWMTAGGGIVHEELHERAFARRGGTVEMVQLWVNLRAADKMTPPAYQPLTADEIPHVETDGATVRVVGGEATLDGRPASGIARTRSPLALLDVVLRAGGALRVSVPAGFDAAVYVRHGAASAGGTAVPALHLAAFDATDAERELTLTAAEATGLLVLLGEPLGEPVAAHGPFVMNTTAELQTAMRDYADGRMGRLGPRDE